MGDTSNKVDWRSGALFRAFEELARAVERVNELAEGLEIGVLEECFEMNVRFNSPVVWGWVLKTNLDSLILSRGFGAEERLFWAKVTHELGPDYIALYRRIGHFMKVVNEA